MLRLEDDVEAQQWKEHGVKENKEQGRASVKVLGKGAVAWGKLPVAQDGMFENSFLRRFMEF